MADGQEEVRTQEVPDAQGCYRATAASSVAPERARWARDANSRAEPSRPAPAGMKEPRKSTPSPAARPTPREARREERPGLCRRHHRPARQPADRAVSRLRTWGRAADTVVGREGKGLWPEDSDQGLSSWSSHGSSG